MARGRFISRSIFDSKKAAGISDRAFVLYVAHVVNADVTGRLESDASALLMLLRRRALVQKLTPDDLMAARLELVDAGLVTTWEGGDFSEVVNFHDHNRIRADREVASKIPPPPGTPAGVLPQSAGVLPAVASNPREDAHTSLSISTSLSRSRSRSGAGGRPPSPTPPSDNGSQRATRTPEPAQRLIFAHRESYRLQNNAAELAGGQPRICPGFAIVEAEKAIRDGCPVDAFADGDLALEFLRIATALYQLELTPSPKAVCKNLGQEFDRPEVEKRHRWPVTWEQWREAQGSPESDAKPGGGTNRPPEGVAGDTGREAAEEEASSG